ncbi:MAG: OmpA family protein [Rhodospirillales bacterium]
MLDDSGGAISSRSGNLKMPGTTYPKSEYFGPPVMVTVPAPEPKPEPKSEMMAAPEPTSPAKPEPAPEPAAVPEPPAPEVAAAPEPASEPEAKQTGAMDTSSTGDAPQPPPEPAALDVTPTATEETAEPVVETAETSTTASTSTETAATGSQESDAIRVVFSGEDTRLPDGAESALDPVAAKASADDSIRIQLRAYAGGGDISASKARRLSLSRALAVRSYLIEQGVRSTRIDVRALGDKVDEEPINRVDIDVGTR